MNMRIRIIACICILSVLVSFFVLNWATNHIGHDPEYSEFTEGISTTAGVYFIENWNGKGRLYQINSTGDVLAMANSDAVDMTEICCIDIADDSVYAVYRAAYRIDEDIYYLYRLAMYNSGLFLLDTSDPFFIDSSETVKSIDDGGDRIYLTTIGENGKAANVYELDKSMLGGAGEDDGAQNVNVPHLTKQYLESIDSPPLVVYRESDSMQYFADAYYNGTDIVILMDTDPLSGKFAVDTRVRDAVSQIHFNLLQQISLYSNYVAWWAGGLALWFVLMAAIYLAVRRRNRSVYAFMIAETVFVLLLVGTVHFLWDNYEENQILTDVRYTTMALQEQLEDLTPLDWNVYYFDYYEDGSYQYMVWRIREFLEMSLNKYTFYDAFIMENSTGTIVVDGMGYTRENVSYVYGQAAEQVRTALLNHEKTSYATFRPNDEDMYIVGIADEDPASNYSLVAVCRLLDGTGSLWGSARSVLVFSLIVFVLGSAALALIFYLVNADLRSFEGAIRDVAMGRSSIQVPDVVPTDLNAMWNSLSEICKRMDEISYERFRVFEAYYRFAPKKIEAIMGKDSIFDVHNGDSVNIQGTLMLLTSESHDFGDRKLKSLTNIMSYMSQFEEAKEGLLVSQDSSLSVLRFFFPDVFSQTAARTAQFLHRNMSDTDAEFVSGFLYNELFLYGVAGIQSQSLCFITSAHMQDIEEYAAWFAQMRVPLVITENVVHREDAGQIRYIGFILLSSDGKRVELYEALDAESARLRQMKLATRERFEDTLQLFYSKEYYLARNRFSEILKECPEDALTRWYVFECERYLNSEVPAGSVGQLRIG